MTEIAKHGWKRMRVAENSEKLLEMAWNGWNGAKWLGKGLEMIGMDENGSKTLEKIGNGRTWLQWLTLALNSCQLLDGQESAIHGCK